VVARREEEERLVDLLIDMLELVISLHERTEALTDDLLGGEGLLERSKGVASSPCAGRPVTCRITRARRAHLFFCFASFSLPCALPDAE
jgi:hypothetical protein